MTVRAATATATDAPRRPWARTPGVPAATTDDLPWPVTEVLALAIALAVPLTRAVAHPWVAELPLVAIAVAASASLALPRWPRKVPRAFVAVAAAAALTPVEGKLFGLWLGIGVLVADWSARRRPPWPGLPPGRPTTLVPVGLSVLAGALIARDLFAVVRPTALLLLAVLVATTGAAWRAGSAHGVPARCAERVGLAAAHLVSRATFTAASAVTIGVTWALHRLVRLDPLAVTDAGWVRRDRTPGPSRARAVPAVGARRTGGVARLQGATVVVVALALVAGAAVGVQRLHERLRSTEAPPPEVALPAQFAESPWYPGYAAELDWYFANDVGFRPFELNRLADVEGRYINVLDGVRRSWSPPRCRCRRVSVWMYGGSTTFGLGQRDEHTIASEIARAAWERDRIAVDIENKGQVGHTHATEAGHLAWDLSARPAPDLVVFYDGVNELWSATLLTAGLEGDLTRPHEPHNENTWGDIVLAQGEDPPAPPGASLPFDRPVGGDSEEDIGRLAVARYERARQISAHLAATHDLPVRWYWQPSVGTRPIVAAEQVTEPDLHAGLVRIQETARAGLAEEVVDLADVLDDDLEPMFTDDVHHNEAASVLVAAALYEDVREELLALAGR